ncbi:MAG: T9SS type A sorting domain-containing protein [Candidatus Krumholzibacteriota bacterium]|nr:T9SS type A sorting domain-containing protein [Candidatus Krumholzibacteriota bacterium]
MRKHAGAFIGFLVLTLAAFPAFAAQHPERPIRTASTGVSLSSGGVEFECGTYAGNEVQTHYLAHKHERLTSDIAAGRTQTLAATLDFVNDDVWIVEDDGTLLFSGLNVFDTDFQTIHFQPNGDGTYTASNVTFNFDATLGSPVATGDDGSVGVVLQFSFSFAGTSWGSMFIGGNGLVSFGAVPNPSGFYDNDDFFNTTPKICPYFMDLNPAAGGGVYHKSEATKHTVTWSNVPDFGTANLNTVQLVLYNDGSFDVTFNGITSTLQANSAPIFVGFSLGSPIDLEILSFSNDLPYVGGIGKGFYEDYLNLTNPLVNEIGLLNRFYANFPDEFFQINFFTNFIQTMAGFANERNIKNDVQGIGLGIFDNSSQYGSAGVLESRTNMNRLNAWPTLPGSRFTTNGNSFLTIMGQEAGHRWGAFLNFRNSGGQVSNLILGRADAHWSYYVNVDNSSLEGGNWEQSGGPNSYVNPTLIDFFPSIDEYCFGLRTPEEVKDLFYISSASNNLPGNRDNGTPILGATATGTKVIVTIEDIISAEGPRVPAEPDEDKDLRQGFILIVQNGVTPTSAELSKVALFRKTWEDYFEVSCDGRLTASTSLTQNFAVGVIKGNVTNKLTDEVITGEFTATSDERGFVQHVSGGGRYTFRYQADAMSGSSENVTIYFEAPGFFPDTLVTSVDYGSELCVDAELLPIPTSVDTGTPLPNALYANYPNPFNPTTTIRFDMQTAATVKLSVYNIQGALVRTLVVGERGAGIHEEVWDGRDNGGRLVASGVYFYRLEMSGFVRTRKMLLVK